MRFQCVLSDVDDDKLKKLSEAVLGDYMLHILSGDVASRLFDDTEGDPTDKEYMEAALGFLREATRDGRLVIDVEAARDWRDQEAYPRKLMTALGGLGGHYVYLNEGEPSPYGPVPPFVLVRAGNREIWAIVVEVGYGQWQAVAGRAATRRQIDETAEVDAVLASRDWLIPPPPDAEPRPAAARFR
jgi:hypothetical protein